MFVKLVISENRNDEESSEQKDKDFFQVYTIGKKCKPGLGRDVQS